MSQSRAEVEAVLPEGESLSELVEASTRARVERRRNQSEFIARGLRSRDEARRTQQYVGADSVIDALQRKLDSARMIPSGSSGSVALFEIESATDLVVIALRHQADDDYH